MRWPAVLLGLLLCSAMPGAVAGGGLKSSTAARAPGASADPRGLRDSIDRLLRREVLDGATVAVEVWSLDRNESVYSHQSDRALIPASNLKVLTIAAALRQFGADHRFETSLASAAGVDRAGVLQGDLVVVGGGDPTLTDRFFDSTRPETPLRRLVAPLVERGIQRVAGDLVVDDRLFDHVFVGPGWPTDQLHKDYCAPVGALSMNGGCLEVVVQPHPSRPSAILLPRTAHYQPTGTLSVSPRAKEMLVDLGRPAPDGDVIVRGRVGPRSDQGRFPVPVVDPGMFTGRALRAVLEAEGIAVEGVVRRIGAEDLQREQRVLYTMRNPIAPALVVCGKESDNAIAEHLFKSVGAAREGVGTFESGGRGCRAALGELGVSMDGFVQVDGSGLSRENQVTTRMMVGVLRAMYASPQRDAFVRSLAISGVDGTLRRRMGETPMQSRVRAKTGYLNRVSGLSGFVGAGREDDVGEVFAFSILINGFKVSNSEMKKVQDDLCRALVRQ